METTIFYYTGTGNSLWVARKLAEGLGNAEVVSMVKWMKKKDPVQSNVIGLVFPVHMWGVPEPVIRFIGELQNLDAGYFFAVGVDADQVANTLVQLKTILAKKGIALDSGFEVKLPTNYIVWGGPGTKEAQDKKITAAGQKISRIVEYIKKREKGTVEKGPLWQRILLTPIYKLSYSKVPTMDKAFFADEKCSRCGTCYLICPAKNITLVEGKPVWNHHCQQCFACIQWCPKEAIQGSKKTHTYQRYHHPEVQLKDMLK
jgi:Pyruvate/2-oxoacid:ferredoxin oxidoreductase delta subunit/flavodoxin